MASKLTDNDDPISEINIVPFVDIVLVVLIIFMVTAPIITMSGLNVDLFKAMSGKKIPPTKINISINAEGEIFLNGHPSTGEEIQSYAQNLTDDFVRTQAVITADQSVSHGTVVRVIDYVKAGGVMGVSMSVRGP